MRPRVGGLQSVTLRQGCGLSHRAISAATGLSKGSFHGYLRRAAKAEVTWEMAHELVWRSPRAARCCCRKFHAPLDDFALQFFAELVGLDECRHVLDAMKDVEQLARRSHARATQSR